MQRVALPDSRDELVRLAELVLANNAEAVRKTGVSAPEELRAVRNARREARAALAPVNRHNDAVASLGERANPPVAALLGALRDFTAILKLRVRSPAHLRRWGLRLKGAAVEYPDDRDEIVTLAKKVIGSDARAAKRSGVTSPAPERRAIQRTLGPARRPLAAIARHQKAVKPLLAGANAKAKRLRRALAAFAAVLKRRLRDPKLLELWGFTVRETAPRGTAAGPTAPPA